MTAPGASAQDPQTQLDGTCAGDFSGTGTVSEAQESSSKRCMKMYPPPTLRNRRRSVEQPCHSSDTQSCNRPGGQCRVQIEEQLIVTFPDAHVDVPP
jgi:hypothetical protein